MFQIISLQTQLSGRIQDGAKLFTSVEVRKLQNNPVYSTCIYLHDYTHVLCNLFAKWKTIKRWVCFVYIN